MSMKNSNDTTGNRTHYLSMIKEKLMKLVSFSVHQNGFGFHINTEKYKVVKNDNILKQVMYLCYTFKFM